MSRAIRKMENTRGFFNKRVKMKALEHLEHMERKVRNGKPCPNARKLKH